MPVTSDNSDSVIITEAKQYMHVLHEINEKRMGESQVLDTVFPQISAADRRVNRQTLIADSTSKASAAECV